MAKEIYPEGKLLLEARKRLNLSRRELAELSQVSEDTIFRIEKMSSGFTYETLNCLSGALGLKEVRFMGRETSSGTILDELYNQAVYHFRRNEFNEAFNATTVFNREYERWIDGLSKTKDTIHDKRKWFGSYYDVLNLSCECAMKRGEMGILFIKKCEKAVIRCGYSLDEIIINAMHLTEPVQQLMNLLALGHMRNGDYGRSTEISQSLFLCLNLDNSRGLYDEMYFGKMASVLCNKSQAELKLGRISNSVDDMVKSLELSYEGSPIYRAGEILKIKEIFFPYLEINSDCNVKMMQVKYMENVYGCKNMKEIKELRGLFRGILML